MIANAGFDAGLNQKSKVERLAWAWKGARANAKERRLNALQAVTAGRELVNNLSAKIVRAGGQPRDVVVMVVFANPANWAERTGIVFQAVSDSADSDDLAAIPQHMRSQCIGFVVGALNRRDGLYISSLRPVILHDSALTALDEVSKKATELIRDAHL